MGWARRSSVGDVARFRREVVKMTGDGVLTTSVMVTGRLPRCPAAQPPNYCSPLLPPSSRRGQRREQERQAGKHAGNTVPEKEAEKEAPNLTKDISADM